MIAKTPSRTENEISIELFGSKINSRTTNRMFERSLLTFALNLLKSRSQWTRPIVGPALYSS